MTEPPRRPRLGVMGGTFDPVHHGHLVAASEVAARFDLDEVVFVPTGQPTFKLDQDVTTAEHRYLMTVIATASNPRFTVSRVDVDRSGVTYTVDTLRDLKTARPDAEDPGLERQLVHDLGSFSGNTHDSPPGVGRVRSVSHDRGW